MAEEIMLKCLVFLTQLKIEQKNISVFTSVDVDIKS